MNCRVLSKTTSAKLGALWSIAAPVHSRFKLRIARKIAPSALPILPINAALLALTPICPFRPRRWRGALLPDSAFVVIEVLEADKRPVAAVADHDEARNAVRVEILSDKTISMRMLFDPGHSLEERILSEQFVER